MNQGTREKKPDPIKLKDLWSTDDNLVLKTLHKLSKAGNLIYVPDLLKLLSQTRNELIEKELIRFLANIKKQDVVPLVVAGLKEPGRKSARAGILSVIWQSGLDYSKHMDLFIQLFLEGDYLVALESFTVIEQSIVHLSDQEIEEKRYNLLNVMDKVSEDKKPLARELVNLLQF
ncbi:MAG: hypothetical protein V3V53_13185 [Bacteroidales bacterium]